MRNIFKVILLVVLGLFLFYAAVTSLAASESSEQPLDVATLIVPAASPVVKEAVPNIENAPFRDNPDIYKDDDPNSVVYMYVTVRKGNPSDNTDHTWQEVNEFTKWFQGRPTYTVVGKAEAILQIGDENGPIPGEVGYGETISNATIQIRGNSNSDAPQKSYKIELRSRAGDWKGQTVINLNKHYGDTTRARNKLSFDLMKQIPGLVSLRTQYVRLFVKDETADPPKITYVDYGLFTHVEQPNRRFLRNHLLDSDGHLYKATFFEFLRYPEQIRLEDDPLFNEAEFSEILEIRGNRDHSKLINMLEDVNNKNLSTEQVFEKYFDANNYFTWLAFNILMGNLDTQSQNFLLYSPRNSNKWYFIPWDYDGDLFRQGREPLGANPYDLFEYGIANYWGVPLHNRVLKVTRYRQLLDAKINELMAFLTPERINNMLADYREVTDLYILQMPDLYYLKVTPQEYDKQYKLIPGEIQLNYDLYQESLLSPMPFFLGTPKVSDNTLMFNWDESYDFNAQDITYHFSISKGWEFNEIVYEESLINENSIQIDLLEPGTYFWRVTATNASGKMQYPFDVYRDANRDPHSGMKYFYISADGEVLEE